MITGAESSNDLWDANDVARYMKASRSWVYHQAEAGNLPHLRIGALLRFDPRGREVLRSRSGGSWR